MRLGAYEFLRPKEQAERFSTLATPEKPVICAYDHHPFTGLQIMIILKFDPQTSTFFVDSLPFCSFNCALAHIISNRKYNPNLLLPLNTFGWQKLFNAKHAIAPAPDVTLLKEYAGEGGLSIEEFRKTFYFPIMIHNNYSIQHQPQSVSILPTSEIVKHAETVLQKLHPILQQQEQEYLQQPREEQPSRVIQITEPSEFQPS